MKTIYRNVLSVTLAFLVVFSSSSFVVSQHYCGSRLIDVTVFGSPDKCFSAVEKPKKQTCVQAKSCCNDIIISIPSYDLVSSSFDVDTNTLTFVLNNTSSISKKEIVTDSKSIFFQNYKPPKLIQDTSILYEVYLI